MTNSQIVKCFQLTFETRKVNVSSQVWPAVNCSTAALKLCTRSGHLYSFITV